MQTIHPTPARPQARTHRRRLAVAACIAFGLNRSSARLNHDLRPAGFVKGMLQGALMPLSLPNLVLGNDVTFKSATTLTGPVAITTAAGGGDIEFCRMFWYIFRKSAMQSLVCMNVLG